MPGRRSSKARAWARAVLAAGFALAGVLHLMRPEPFLAITPDWVPQAETVIQVTGVCELAGAAGLFLPALRRAAGMGLALYAVCVFPANIKHALDQVVVGGATLGWWYHGPRWAFQPVIVWWALWASGTTDWPFDRGRPRRSSRASSPRSSDPHTPRRSRPKAGPADGA